MKLLSISEEVVLVIRVGRVTEVTGHRGHGSQRSRVTEVTGHRGHGSQRGESHEILWCSESHLFWGVH